MVTFLIIMKIVFLLFNVHILLLFFFFKNIIGEELLIPTKIYASAIKPLLLTSRIKAMAHITGKFIAKKNRFLI